MATRQAAQFLEICKTRYAVDAMTNISPKILSSIGKCLYEKRDSPIYFISERVRQYFNTNLYNEFKYPSPVVTTEDNFDSLLIPKDHVSRDKRDTYYVNAQHLLRSHTSAHQMHCLKQGSKSFLCIADCYRRDTIDSSHFPIFHQCEVFRLYNDKEALATTTNRAINTVYDDTRLENEQKQSIYNQESSKFVEVELKKTIEQFVLDLLEDPTLNMRWVGAYFPFTHPSFELEIFWKGQWIEILGCGVVRDDILKNAGIRDHIGFAAGFGLERLAMLKYQINDIRLFWSNDAGFSSQFINKSPNDKIVFKPFAQSPPCVNDLSFWLPNKSESDEMSPNDFYDLVRSVGGDLVETVTLIDEFKDKKSNRVSNCYRIVYRCCDRALSKEEVNVIHENIAKSCCEQFGVQIR